MGAMKEGDIRAAPRQPFDLFDFRRRIDLETANGYRDFRRSLTPDFARIRRDIALGYAALAALLLCVSQVPGAIAGLAAATLGAVAVGYGIAYLQLFIHEAAHYNLAADRKTNDRMANALICWQVGTDIATYRRTHAKHHQHLGQKGDTEISYTRPLTLRFVVEMVTAIHALRVFLDRRGRVAPSARTKASSAPLVTGAAVHLILIALLLWFGAWPAALAWIGGVGVIFPIFATVRQLLEHRPSARVADFAEGEGEGAVTRLFDDGLFARTFGGAGFNRHLLHHLEPQISYTRLAEFEAFLMNTSAREALEARRSTYFGAFRELWADDRRH
jgi:fatty acid desaturase